MFSMDYQDNLDQIRWSLHKIRTEFSGPELTGREISNLWIQLGHIQVAAMQARDEVNNIMLEMSRVA